MVSNKIVSSLILFSLIIISCRTSTNFKTDVNNTNCYDTMRAISKLKEYSYKILKPISYEQLSINIVNCDSVKALKRINQTNYIEPNLYSCDTAFYVNVRNLENNKVLNLILDCKTCKIKPFPKIHRVKK